MQDLTTGSLSKHLLRTMSFMLVGMTFQTLYILIDLYWVGHLGTTAVAGVGLSTNLMFVVLALTQMLGVGTTALISHAVGRKDQAHARVVFHQAQTLALAVGVIFFAGGMLVRVPFCRAMAADAATAAMAADYLSWFIPGMALQFPLVAMGAALRGTGAFKPGMIVQMGTVVLNMTLAPLLMFGWLSPTPMGVRGAALATFIAIAVGVAWMLWYYRPGAYLTYERASWTPRPDLWKRILQIGLPAGAEFLLITAYMLLVYHVSRPFGAAAQAGFGIGGRVIQAAFLPVIALGFAVAPVAGQNFGARLPDRVRRTFTDAVAMAASVMIVAALLLQAFPAPIIRVFSDDAGVIAFGVEYVRIIAWAFIASGVTFVTSSMFQALGNTIPALMTSVIRVTAVAVPVLLLSRRADFSMRWMWWLSLGAVYLQMTLNLLLLRREFRRKL